jgi:replication factor C subunit 2/4
MSLIQKYKPTTIDDMILDDTLKRRFNGLKYNLSNIIINGSSGVGKTLATECLISDIFKDDRKSVFNVNIFSEPKKMIYDMLTFCKVRHTSKYPYKIVVVDDFDNINEKIQKQIAIIMEAYQNKVKFIFTSITSVEIIQQIQSRTLIIVMYCPREEQLINFATMICNNEKIEYTDEAIIKLVKNSQCDFRTLLNNLEILADKKITVKRIEDIYKFPQTEFIIKVLNYCIKSNLKEAVKQIIQIKQSGYSSFDIVNEMFQVLQSEFEDVPMKEKMILLDKICDTTYNISNSIDSDLQLYNLLCELCS